MRTISIISAIGITLSSLILTNEALAIPILTFAPSSATAFGEGGSPGSTRGWEFNVVSPDGITVAALGIFDEGADGLSGSHAVGIWNSSGSLLASVTIPAGTVAPLDANGLFRLVNISDIWLPQGTDYRIGAYYSNGSSDTFQGGVNSLSVDPSISFVQAMNAINVATLTYPTVTYSFENPGYFGPSFEIVPEPSFIALILTSMGLLIRQRRRV